MLGDRVSGPVPEAADFVGGEVERGWRHAAH